MKNDKRPVERQIGDLGVIETNDSQAVTVHQHGLSSSLTTQSSLTDEQRLVIAHPTGNHARVLAVAGSGKTTTMVYRLKYLLDLGHRPHSMLVLMFNRLAREQFEKKLEQIGILLRDAPRVRTFHSLAFNFISDLKKHGLLAPDYDMWIDDKEELVRITMHRAIATLVKEGRLVVNQIDIEEALNAVSLWKGSLIPPDRAGYRGDPNMPMVYKRFEAMRIEKLGLTFDDFVPLAVHYLERNSRMQERWCNRLKFLIVDEYQDVNYGQQRFIELLAGRDKGGADVMVVGDDDQTIYEWRGARPEYIIREFKAQFDNKAITDYKLTNSFRFGCQIAQAAYHLIDMNTNRVPKRLLAHNPKAESIIHLVENSSCQQSEIDFAIADSIVALVKDMKISPVRLIVIGRTFSQTSSVQAAFLARSVPFKVVGQAPFFERKENVTLLDYIRLAGALDNPCTNATEPHLLNIANTPNRYLTRSYIETVTRGGIRKGHTLRQVLSVFYDPSDSPFSSEGRRRARELHEFLDRLNERLNKRRVLKAGKLLQWIVDTLGYIDHIRNYFGKGETSFEREASVQHFLAYATSVDLPPIEFVKHIEKLDSTLGLQDEQLVVITTIHRVKGLEYDYVFVPSMQEGNMPCLIGDGLKIYDTKGIIKEPDPSETIENERRLCYVALTRARKAVFIGTSSPPERGKQAKSSMPLPSRFLDEMELPAVKPLMEALRNTLVTGRAQRTLIKLAQRHDNNYKLLSSLQDGYLRHIPSEEVRRAIQSIVKAEAERPFTYSYAYASSPRTREQQPKPDEEIWPHINSNLTPPI